MRPSVLISTLVFMFLSCIYPTYEDDPFVLEERHSIWQHLNVYSIYQERLPPELGLRTPDMLFNAINDTFCAVKYTGYADVSMKDCHSGNEGRSLNDTLFNITDSTLYYRFSGFSDNVLNFFSSRVSYMGGHRHIIIDLRNNGGGSVGVVEEMTEEFLPFNTPYIYYRERYYNPKTRSGLTTADTMRSKNRVPQMANMKIAILVNHNSASASELMASALRDAAGAYIIGDTTYGKGIGQLTIRRTGRRPIRITHMEISGITGRTGHYHRKGLAPDTFDGQKLAEAASLFPQDIPLGLAMRLFEPEITPEQAPEQTARLRRAAESVRSAHEALRGERLCVGAFVELYDPLSEE